MVKQIKILCVHGLGNHTDGTWEGRWEIAVRQAFHLPEDHELKFEFLNYDHIFLDVDLSFFETMEAAVKLGWSGLTSVFRPKRGLLSGITDRIRWTAGYVVAWCADDDFKKRSREFILSEVADKKPDIILAHSLGSLLTYDAFAHKDAEADAIRKVLRKAVYVTFGSQLNNPFVLKNLTNGRIGELGVEFWHHLFNRHDDVFTRPIVNTGANNFRQTLTPFDIEGIADHDATEYLGHQQTVADVWMPYAALLGANRRTVKSVRGMTRKRQKVQKALLVGINDYPNEGDRLDGCVNDVFTMSEVLQRGGMPASSIRTCLDSRATAKGILERMAWLLDDPGPGDELVFYYSGHGARYPEYGPDGEPDRYVETLVPWDFDWSEETSIADRQIYDLYSQLPYDCRLVMIFDCCNSGGIHKNGKPAIKGITPPDDIRHRELKWDMKTNTWVQRSFTRINKDFTSNTEIAGKYFGPQGATERIGRASMIRGLTEKQYDALKKKDVEAAEGAYLPVIIEACRAEQYSYEYRHGVTSHGAFTFNIAKILRERKRISFEDLVVETRKELADLGFDQEPSILGPSEIVKSHVPFAD
ncbi:caspase family protein [Roseibium aggregatum]|uniref:Caspase family protein n=1 Tax=Roseibium aggregatum TaxID=187304 RepID=A0A939IZC7_9HYPH|nr:caspase family protein [Roseibium aggregatum]MBN9669911.1 caspase family protein [Roseibium aggregatum]